MHGMTIDLGRVGIWSRELRFNQDAGRRGEAAAELEDLGYSALFIPDVGGDVMSAVDLLLRSTRRIAVATGIVNIWVHSAEEIAEGRAGIERAHPGRFVLGLGCGHAPTADAIVPGSYRRPVEKMEGFLDQLDAAPAPAAGDSRILAALGPRMLAMARERAGGAHPYLVTPEHTGMARQVLGSERVLAPEQAVVLDADPVLARERGRQFLSGYLALPNYVANFRRMGFGDADFEAGGSDSFVDALVAWGDEEAIGRRVSAHHDAGADHVCIYVFGGPDEALPLEAWRRLAPVLVASSGPR
jgi:probable F420-dependent oxidoreductase